MPAPSSTSASSPSSTSATSPSVSAPLTTQTSSLASSPPILQCLKFAILSILKVRNSLVNADSTHFVCLSSFEDQRVKCFLFVLSES
ncbi:hypothetical protein ACFX1T_037885 [Malus domestica]